MKRNLLLSGLGIFGAYYLYLYFFDRDVKTIKDEINAERARRVHTRRLPYLP